MPLDASTRAMLQQWRRRGAPPERRLPTLALAVALLLHALFMLAIWHEMRPPVSAAAAPERPDDVLQVRFIASAPQAATPPPPLPAPPRVILKQPVPAARNAMTMQLATPTPTPAPAAVPQLYDRDGLPRLPAAAASTAVPGYVQRMPAGDTRIMQHTSPVPYKATRFEQYFPPPGETLGGAVLRHVVEAVVKSTDVNLPHGVHLKCTTLLGVPIPNCINPPAPPSKKDGDERLSMAPAKPLAVDPHAPPPPSVAACIAMYRAGRPLAWGCPADTPNRSVDAQLRKHPAATGQP